ncbi:MAG: hypothetical protein WC650_01240 [Candidatus Doudnabacteria bacterium]
MPAIAGIVSKTPDLMTRGFKNTCAQEITHMMTCQARYGGSLGGIAVTNEKSFSTPFPIHRLNAPFYERFDEIALKMIGGMVIAAQTNHPQPLAFDTKFGRIAIVTLGHLQNPRHLRNRLIAEGHSLTLVGDRTNPTELILKTMARADNLKQGIKEIFQTTKGSVSFLMMTEKGELIVVRDFWGRGSLILGARSEAIAVVCESCALQNSGFEIQRALGPGEAIQINPDLSIQSLITPQDSMSLCPFNSAYYSSEATLHFTLGGKPILTEEARKAAGRTLGQRLKEWLAQHGKQDANYILVPVPGTGIPIARGAHEICPEIPLVEALKKEPGYGQSYTPTEPQLRKLVAARKLYIIKEYIQGRTLILVEDSIVRGNQLRDLILFLTSLGAQGVILLVSFPMIFYKCPYFETTRSTADLAVRQAMRALELNEKQISQIADPRSILHQKVAAKVAEMKSAMAVIYQAPWDYLPAIGLPDNEACQTCWRPPINPMDC